MPDDYGIVSDDVHTPIFVPPAKILAACGRRQRALRTHKAPRRRTLLHVNSPGASTKGSGVQQGLNNEPFAGYIMEGAPCRQPRLWFLDRHLRTLIEVGAWNVIGQDGLLGHWTHDVPAPGVPSPAHYLSLRYEHVNADGSTLWKAVWRLTETTIPHIHIFGGDDTWRLGIWPD